MAPAYRNSNRRQNRTGYVDHDVFEGLPVRHWRRDYVTVAPPPTQENTTSKNDIWAIELPHGMPKDSHLLPQHSQDLLRAARSGRIYKRPAPVEEEEVDPEVILGEKPEKKEDDPRDKGFTAKAWKQIPRHLEGPDIEYLAKRRKGLITLASKAAAPGPMMTKTTVRRTDAAGNEYVQDVIVSKGQQVEGEVISQTTIPDPAATDGFAQPTPPKRKGAPPKNKKMKGLGRGRKKKVVGPTSVPEMVQVDGVAQSVEGGEAAPGPDPVKVENGDGTGSVAPIANEDTEIAEGSMAASDEDGGEDGEEGDEGDDDEGSVSAMDSPSKPLRPFSPGISDLPHMKEPPNFDLVDADMSGIDDLPGPPLPAPTLPKLEILEGKSGSPLKNVALTTSTLTSPIKSPDTAPTFSNVPPPQESTNVPETAERTALNEEMHQETAETAPPTLPPPPPEPTVTEIVAAVETRQQEEEEEEMLLDIVENTNDANIGAPHDSVPVALEVPAELIFPAQESESIVSTQEQEMPSLPAAVEDTAVEGVVEQPVGEGGFTDLLDGLEKQLNEPEVVPPAQPESVPEIPEEAAPEKAIEPEAETVEPVGEGKEMMEEVKETTDDA